MIALWVKMLKIPEPLLYGGILMFATIGTYGISQSVVDLILLYIIGGLGFLMRRFDFPTAPVIIGMILGPLAEQNFRQAMTISQGDISVLVTRPLSLVAAGLGGAGAVWAANLAIGAGRADVTERCGLDASIQAVLSLDSAIRSRQTALAASMFGSDPCHQISCCPPSCRRLARVSCIARLMSTMAIPHAMRRWIGYIATFLNPGDLAFDIGSHVGDRVGAFRRAGARVVALEPQPDCARVVRQIYSSPTKTSQ